MSFYSKYPQLLGVVSGLLLTLPTTQLVHGRSFDPVAHTPPTLPIAFNNNFEPPGDDAPDSTVGAGSRTNSACPGDEGNLRSHMPERNYGLTTKDQPGIYVQLSNTTAQQVVLAFRNEANTYYERAFLPLPDIDSQAETLIRFALPDQAPPLAVGENYHWTLVLVCGETVQPDDPILTGWVQRTATFPSRPIKHGAVEWLAQNGYWYDLLDALYRVSQHETVVQIGTLLP